MRYRVHAHRLKGKATHLPVGVTGIVTSFTLCPAHSAPLALIRHDLGTSYIIAPEGLAIGDSVSTQSVGAAASIPLRDVPEGSLLYNLESKPGDGGTLVRAAGTFARLQSKTESHAIIILPSKQQKKLLLDCRVSLGVVAGGGKNDKPFVKAGKKYHAARARGGKIFPRTSGVAMNATDHPFGSGRGRHKGKPSIAPRDAPPGRKVGQVRARRTGKKR